MISNFYPTVMVFIRKCGKISQNRRATDRSIMVVKQSYTHTHTHTHTNCVTLIAFPRQLWLRERSSILCLHLRCLSPLKVKIDSFPLNVFVRVVDIADGDWQITPASSDNASCRNTLLCVYCWLPIEECLCCLKILFFPEANKKVVNIVKFLFNIYV